MSSTLLFIDERPQFYLFDLTLKAKTNRGKKSEKDWCWIQALSELKWRNQQTGRFQSLVLYYPWFYFVDWRFSSSLHMCVEREILYLERYLERVH